MRKTLFLSLLLAFLVLANGCVYQAALSQGNLLDQEDIDQVEVGMTRGQVRFLLGTPMIDDPFHEDRWDYVQTFSRRGNPMVQRTITLRFEDGLLSEIGGQDTAFSSGAGGVSGDATEVASFVKKPGKTPSPSSATDPQDAPLGTAEEDQEEGADLDIDTIQERTSEDTEYEMERDDDLSGPDIDG